MSSFLFIVLTPNSEDVLVTCGKKKTAKDDETESKDDPKVKEETEEKTENENEDAAGENEQKLDGDVNGNEQKDGDGKTDDKIDDSLKENEVIETGSVGSEVIDEGTNVDLAEVKVRVDDGEDNTESSKEASSDESEADEKQVGRFLVKVTEDKSDNEEGGNVGEDTTRSTSSMTRSVSSNRSLSPLKAVGSNRSMEKIAMETKISTAEVSEETPTGENTLTEVESGELTPLVILEMPLYKKVDEMLESFGITTIDREVIGNSKYRKFSFILDDSQMCEKVLNKLGTLGVGSVKDSSFSVFPSSLYNGYKPRENEEDEENGGGVSTNADLLATARRLRKQESSSREVFMKSIKSRLVVQQVVNTVTANAQFTFDYLLLIILASLISCMGLVESSSVVLVASMLISPLMGPILATTFGQVIQNHGLRNLGLKSELSGLLICIFVGFVFGLVTGSFGLKGAVWGSTDQWPTQEMASRGELRALWVGMLIAVPSGAGVALSVLGGNAGSLVGVAISASLLPPACNAGMLWAYSFLAAISPPEIVQTATTLLTTAMPLTTAMIDNITITIATNTTISTTAPTATNPTHLASEGTCLALVNNAYVPVYSCSVPREAAMLGAISLLLTILNILCIIAMGVLVLRIKEVAPETAGPIKSFFSEDIHVARSYNTTQKGVTGNTLGKQLLSEWSLYKEQQAQSDQDGLSKEIGVVEFVNQIKDIEMSPYTQHLLSNLPNRSSWAVHNELSPEYDMAVNRLNEQLSKHPSVYLADASVTDQRIKQAYNTIHHIPGQQNSMGAEFRRHLKQRSSARNMRPVSTVLETVSETSLNSNKNEQPSVAPTAASGRNLLNFTSNKLFKRRKPRVQFKEGESDSLV
ncbi:uncharacterized protein LOC128212946 isoform X1 [Mya arenaria]|uniref:uncharacterized protein LOC128212946 isoform X1 n=1 Tax=Mya arenaria TaxID=6604 RepID=UPI0022DF74A9|nr:uncharacterized protein LOC128212946 isoform X1 [Mya arenaria]